MVEMIRKHKSVMALLLIIAMAAALLPSAVGFAASYKENQMIEFEKLQLSGSFKAFTDMPTAQGGGYIMSTDTPGVKLMDPDSLSEPEATVTFTADKEAKYNVWMRYIAADNGMDSLHIGLDDEKYTTELGTSVKITGDTQWSWMIVKSYALKAGTHTLKFAHREPGLKMDALYITSDNSYKPDGVIAGTTPVATAAPAASGDPAKTPAPVTPAGVMMTMTDNSAIFEAEVNKVSPPAIEISDAKASGGKMVGFNPAARVDDPVAYGKPPLSYAFTVEKKGNYTVWSRAFVPDMGGDSLWVNFDSMPYAQGKLEINTTEFTWSKIFTAPLEAGVHTMNIVQREAGVQLDKFIITNSGGFIPTGEGQLPTKDTLYASAYPTPSFTPPPEHPRLYFRKADIPRLLENAAKPQNAKAWEKYLSNLEFQTDGKLPDSVNGKTNINNNLLAVFESWALDYALRGNEEAGKEVVPAMRNYIDTVVFDKGDYNSTGQTIITIAMVYDWCYPLLTDEDKEAFAEAVTSIAAQMEIGWPPTKQGAITGHGSEAQIMRDLIGAGVALYDERPDIYNNAAGRFFKEYVDARKFSYPAHMQHQGDHYSQYRYQWEIIATWIFDRMGLPQVFGPDQQYVPYWWLYARRPDGQLLRDGDSSANNFVRGFYWNKYARSLLNTANYFKDPYLKKEGMREMPMLGGFSSSGNQSMTCVEFLLFNDPDLEGRPVSELPLTKYFPSPMGSMIARTGWEDGENSPAVVAEMKVNEYWFGNHQHLDAGHFQLYYKGILANDTGYYIGAVWSASGPNGKPGDTGYGSDHDMNYNKRSIAHNTMLVYDPSEVMSYGTPRANDGGQRIPENGLEPANMEKFLSGSYRTGEVQGYELGGDTQTPDYSYLKGDITKAYSSKVQDYDRSFMFLNLKDKDHPAAMVIFDRVVSSKPEFKKTWLLHGLYEPEINGNQTVFKNNQYGYNGKLTVDTLLPKADNAVIEKVGGEGKEFMVEGKNYDAIPVSNGNNEGGGWRMELSPKTPAQTDYFLNVLQVGDAQPDMPSLPVNMIETEQVAGAVIADRVVVFSKNNGRTKDEVKFSVTGEGSYQFTVADLEKGTWKVEKDGVSQGDTVVTKEGGVAAFTGAAGNYKLTYLSESGERSTIKTPIPTCEGIDIKVDGEFLYTDVAPTVINDRTLVPMRAIFERLGATVQWDEAAQTVTATKGENVIKLTIDSSTATLNGQEITLDVAPMVISGRTMVPVRFVSESMGGKVDWDPFAQTVIITPGVKIFSYGDDTIPIVDCKWSDHFEDTVGTLSYDGDSTTLWSVAGYKDQWIQYDFGSVVGVKGASVMWNKGDQRQAIFNMESSEDAKTWRKVYEGRSSGTVADGFEDAIFTEPVNARYIRVNCFGNSVSEWNAIKEIKFYKNK